MSNKRLSYPARILALLREHTGTIVYRDDMHVLLGAAGERWALSRAIDMNVHKARKQLEKGENIYCIYGVGYIHIDTNARKPIALAKGVI